MSKNRKVKVWHCRFGHASNVRIITTFKLLTAINNLNKAYDPTEIYSNFEQSNNSNPSNNKGLIFIAKVSLLTPSPNNDFDSLYIPCITSKQTNIVLRNKLMNKVNKKLDKVHVDL